MPLHDHTEKLRVEVSFPKKGNYSASANIYFHISVVRFFKTLTREQIERIQQRLVTAGKQYFGETALEFEFNVHIDNEHGLRSWNCPGNACGFDPSHNEWEHMIKEDKEWILYLPHNTDRSEQLVFLLAAACWFRELAEAGL
ncbi:hypothetical protein LCGC14_0160070 [marine sediment metagenome]|uniref:Uncharacterized protein n=1 Tax=marine sediment metagenome TaxID=412755 RepID=A0A0F9UVH7_9ZZZZ|nr:hypothetical protein [Candidatus Nealsonbacteria bacterium]